MAKTIKNNYAVDGIGMIKTVSKVVKGDGDINGAFFEALFHVCMMLDSFFETYGMNTTKFRECNGPIDFYVLGGSVLLQAEIMLHDMKGEMENEETDNSND